MYHGVTREPDPSSPSCFVHERAFRRQIAYIDSRFQVVRLAEALDRLRDDSGGPDMAVLTFDDGFQNNYDVAFPVLREANLPATVFPVTGLLGSRDTLWYCRLADALARTERDSFRWKGRSFVLDGAKSRLKIAAVIEETLKGYAHPRLLLETRRICSTLGIDPDEPIEPGSPFRLLDAGTIREMVDSGLIDIGGHTTSHAILGRLPVEEQRREISGCLESIRDITGRPCTLFAYPNGTPGDYDAETVAILRESGIRVAVTTTWGINDPEVPHLLLKRFGTNLRLPHFLFRAEIRYGTLLHRLETRRR